MSDDADSDAKIKAEICEELAAGINERVPGFPGGFEMIRDSMLSGLDLELVDDKIDRMLHRHEKDRIIRIAIRIAYGALPRFGKLIDELAKEAKRRKRIMDAALIVAEDCEDVFAGLMKSLDYGISKGFVEGTTRIRRARRRARQRAHRFFWATVAAVWLAVVITPLSWEYGVAITLTAAGLRWWAKRSFNLYRRAPEPEPESHHR